MRYKQIYILLTLALMAACQRSPIETATVPEPLPDAGIRSSVHSLPSAPLGVYVSFYLSVYTPSFPASAFRAVQAQMNMLPSEEQTGEADDNFAFLQRMGTALSLDIPDFLNRSPNRAAALESYMQSLKNLSARAVERTNVLDLEEKKIADDVRTARKVATDRQRELDRAIREKDFTTAGNVQTELTDAQTALALLQAQEKEKTELLELLKEFTDLAEQRLLAIEKNREVLIAGLKVVDVPGVTDLGLLESGKRGTRPRSGGIFGPSL